MFLVFLVFKSQREVSLSPFPVIRFNSFFNSRKTSTGGDVSEDSWEIGQDGGRSHPGESRVWLDQVRLLKNPQGESCKVSEVPHLEMCGKDDYTESLVCFGVVDEGNRRMGRHASHPLEGSTGNN